MLQKAYGRLALPRAWAFSQESKKSHVRVVNRPFMALAVHDKVQAPLADRL